MLAVEGTSEDSDGEAKPTFLMQPSGSMPQLESGWLSNALQQHFLGLGKMLSCCFFGCKTIALCLTKQNVSTRFVTLLCLGKSRPIAACSLFFRA